MKRHTLAIAAALSAVALGATHAQTANEHAAHHPDAASAPAAASAAAATTPAPAAAQMARMDQHMKAMQEMHEKMARARTPEERQALMAEHMKLMQEGMALMGGMGPGAGMGGMGMQGGRSMPADPAARMQMMEKRMDMMQSMMQMMMDRMPGPPSRP